MARLDYDVIIAGGGIAGLITATSIAHHSRQNFKVLVIDRNPPQEAGKKTHTGWTCGDATSKRSLEFLEKNLSIRYGSPEIEHSVKGVYVYSPDHKSRVLFEGEGYMLNRKLLPKRQVRDAEERGVEFMFSATAEKLLAEDGKIIGIAGRAGNGEPFKLYTKIVIDATGSSSILRRFLPIKSYIEREINMDDIVGTGRYILEFDRGAEDETYFTPDYCIIHLDQFMAPAGYCLAPDTLVLCKEGAKPIEEIKIGDEVLTSVGWIPVSNISTRYFEGELVAITPSMLNQEVKLTPEHLVRVWDNTGGERWERADKLVDLGEDGYLIVPLPTQSSQIRIQEISVGEEGSNVGLHLSNGSIGNKICNIYDESLTLLEPSSKIFSQAELGISEAFERECEKPLLTPQKSTISDDHFDADLTELSLRVRSALYNKDMILPSWIHDLPLGLKKTFLVSLFGDLSSGNSITTASNAIAFGIWLLLAEISIVASIKKDEGRWIISIKDANGRPKKASNRHDFLLRNDKVLLKILNIRRINYSGLVYDLNTGGDFTSLFNVHNCWVFPKGNNKVNIGLGVSKSGLERRNRLFGLKDNLQSLIDQYVRTNPVIINPRQPEGESDSGNTKGNWQVPVRRHNDCMVANGFAIVGDAAWMPRPIDAGGISPAIYGGVILGRVVAEALEAGDTSEEVLWKYNVEYMKAHGYPMASFEVLRRYLQTITNEQINYGMKHFLSEEDVQAITERQHPRFGKVRFANPFMWFRVLKEINLARGLRYTVKKSQILVELNLNYPDSPQLFEDWKKKLHKELNETVERFKL